MGHVLTVPDDEFGVEGRSESFCLYPAEKHERVQEDGRWKDGKPVRWFVTYERSVEFLYADIPALRRALDRAEQYQNVRAADESARR